jgi:formylglycine-generating enzyme required for sulfatase activity
MRSGCVAIATLIAIVVEGCAGSSVGRPPSDAVLRDTWTRRRDRMEMVYLPAGEYRMGSADDEVAIAVELCDKYHAGCHTCDPERDICKSAWYANEQPAHAVAMDAFWLDRTEVTTTQYQRCERSGACDAPAKPSLYTIHSYYGNSEYGNYPVINVSWGQAAAYCEWVGGRLPTEAEWEYAARGADWRMFPWGEGLDGTQMNHCDANCWYGWRDESTDDGYEVTAPVGSFPEGESWCGALDLAGNVWEWVADWYADDYYSSSPTENPRGPATGEFRVIRGGSWGLEPVYAHSTHRGKADPGRTKIYWGFRCVIGAG